MSPPGASRASSADGVPGSGGGPATVGDVGEIALVERILEGLGADPAGVPELVLGPGDDGAVVECAGTGRWVLTTDVQHEGIHFRRDWIDPEALGRRLLAVNLSDVAAMGGRPAWAVVALSLPPDTPLELVDGLVEGLREGGREMGCTVVGGDVARVPDRLGLCLTALGRLEAGPLRRDGARPGDGCWITGRPGRAGMGRRLLEAGRRPGDGAHDRDDGARRREGTAGPPADHDVEACLEAFLRPRPPLALGRRLAAEGLATAAIDVSDGVALDAARVCRASGVGLLLDAGELGRDPVLERLARNAADDGGHPAGPVEPADPAARVEPGGPGDPVDPTGPTDRADRMDPADLALGGGEDYQLLLAVSPDREEEVATAARECDVEIARVGRFTGADEGLRLQRGDRVEELEPAGWDHFASAAS